MALLSVSFVLMFRMILDSSFVSCVLFSCNVLMRSAFNILFYFRFLVWFVLSFPFWYDFAFFAFVMPLLIKARM
jgi:hypothetical protein